MGGTTSKLEATDWQLANGKLLDDSESSGRQDATLDGAPPTSEYKVYHLIKKGVNQREFDVTDEQDNLLYTTKQVPGTIACFDVLGKEMDAYLLRVTVDMARRYWTVHRYQVATFEDQKPDKVATEKVAAERLLDVERQGESSHAVESFHTPLLFRRACITVSWSRYMAVATMFGTPSQAQLDKYNQPDSDEEDEISEEMMELQDSAGETTKQRNNSILRRASRMTERIRARTSATASAKADYYKPIKITGVNNPSNGLLGSYDDDGSDSDKSGRNSNSSSNNHDLSSSPSSPPPLASGGVEVLQDNIKEQDKHDPSSMKNSANAQEEHDNSDDKEVESITALMNQNSECADTVDDTPEDAHVDESGTCAGSSDESATVLASAMSADDSGCNAKSAIGTASSSTTVTDTSIDGADAAANSTVEEPQDVVSSSLSTTEERPPIRPCNSMPIMKGPPLDADELPSENDGTEKESPPIAPDRPVPERPYSSMSLPPRQRGLPGRPYNSFTTSLKRETSDGSSSTTARSTKTIGKWIRQQSQSFRDTYSRPKKPKKEDPLEGVIRLDQPLLLCQEIYNKIIGNHQTSLVSKEQVVELLQQDEAQHQLEKKNDKDGKDDGENAVLAQEILESAAAVANKQDSPSSPGGGVAESKSCDDDDSSPGNGVAEHKSNDDKETADGGTTEGGTDANGVDEKDQGREDDDQQPLVGYWAWENTLRTHKMKMHLAKGSDLALHIVLAIIVNQVRYERNAIAMTI